MKGGWGRISMFFKFSISISFSTVLAFVNPSFQCNQSHFLWLIPAPFYPAFIGLLTVSTYLLIDIDVIFITDLF